MGRSRIVGGRPRGDRLPVFLIFTRLMMNTAVDLPAPTAAVPRNVSREESARELATIRVGLTEAHGMAKELSQFPADGVQYSFLRPSRGPRAGVGASAIKGLISNYEADDVDVIEAVLGPIRTRNRWVCSLAHIAEACGFDVDGVAPPRPVRVAKIKQLIARENFKQLIFWSHAGHDTLGSYAGIDASVLAGKISVVYPAVRRVADDLVGYRTGDLRLLFLGDFFRKGGVHVVDAFERAQRRYPGISLVVCCDERTEFNTSNRSLRTEYLNKINTLPGIVNKGRVAREELMTEVYPNTDIFLIPTYVETFGMAILEAMAFGIPVVSTNHFAIPEMIEDGVSGLLIDTTRFECDQLFRGYTVPDIPAEFREYMTDAVFVQMCRLIESVALRRSIGGEALKVARTKFSFERRNATIREIYRQALVD
jgi:glycosyltransferase involved in cell wall biosynthesis